MNIIFVTTTEAKIWILSGKNCGRIKVNYDLCSSVPPYLPMMHNLKIILRIFDEHQFVTTTEADIVISSIQLNIDPNKEILWA